MDKLERVDIPHSDRPTYAGEEREEGEQKTDENNKTEQDAVSAPDSADMGDSDRAKTLLSKLSAVLSRPYREMMEAQQAQAEAREPRFVPQNLGLRKYSLPSPAVMPPMGMVSAPQNASAAQGAQAAQQNLPQPSQGPVGGGSNPQHNPIQAFGPLGAKGQLNGNAAFGQKHSPDSLKTAGWKDIFGARKSQPGWYGPEGLVEVQGGGYRYGHQHGVDVLDAPPGWLRRIFDRDPYVLRSDVPRYKRQLKAIKGMTVSETPDRLEFSHMGQLKPEMRQLIEAALAKHSSAKNTALAALTSMESRSILDDDETELAHKQAKTQACSCGCGDTVTTCKCASSCSCRKPGGSCYKNEKPDSLKTATANPSILADLEKISIDVAQGGLPARAISSTVGHIGAFPASLMIDRRTHQNSSNWQGANGSIFDRAINPNDRRAQQFNTLAKDMARVRPQELKNTQVYLGGPRFFEEMRRGYTNPRTSVLGKALSTVTTPLSYAISAATRGDSYNPTTDSIYSYSNSPAIFSHELGHAIDFNKAPIAKTFLGRQWQGLKRDVGGIATRLGPLVVRNEAAANSNSLQALQEAYKNQPEKLQPLLQARQRTLPAAMGSYVGGATFGTAAGLNQAAKVLPNYLPKVAPTLATKIAPHLGSLARATNWANLAVPRTAAILAAIGAGKLYGIARAARNKKAGATPAWQRSEGKNEEGGLNEAGRKSYEREHGGDLKPPVTESNPSGDRAKRRNSFCSRMCGMKRVNTGAKTKNDPDSRINKSLRKWNCKCSSARDLINIALGHAR